MPRPLRAEDRGLLGLQLVERHPGVLGEQRRTHQVQSLPGGQFAGGSCRGTELPRLTTTRARERGTRARERGTRARERGTRGAERGTRGAERGTRAPHRGTRATERGTRVPTHLRPVRPGLMQPPKPRC
ncbi:hypothetical protein CF166_14090 [Amycolatopsis sp. KNN50.9b]|nr:hypothetical protein CF166_14090 [Amycolatopsis sp. KNN50.9b]